MGGIESAGWRLVYSDQPNLVIKHFEQMNKSMDVSAALGFSVRSNGDIGDVIPNSPAARAGIATGSRIIAVNGRQFSTDTLRDVLKASTTSTSPIELIVENGQFYTTVRMPYTGGLRYPHLERISGKPDLLEVLGRPLAKKK